MARVVAQAVSGIEPEWVMMAPVAGVERVLEAGWSKQPSRDLYELNEAFSVQALAVTRELGLDARKSQCERRRGRSRPSHRGKRGAGAGDIAL